MKRAISGKASMQSTPAKVKGRFGAILQLVPPFVDRITATDEVRPAIHVPARNARDRVPDVVPMLKVGPAVVVVRLLVDGRARTVAPLSCVSTIQVLSVPV